MWTAIIETDWLKLGKDIISGLINGLGKMGNALWEAAKKVANSVLDSIKKALGIKSPSRVMAEEVGRFIPPGVAVGIEGNTKPLTDAMEELSHMTTDAIKTDLDINSAIATTSTAAVVPRIKDSERSAESTLDKILAVMEELADRNVEVQDTIAVLLREILEAILGIHIGDGDVYEAVERYRMKKTVATGGAGW